MITQQQHRHTRLIIRSTMSLMLTIAGIYGLVMLVFNAAMAETERRDAMRYESCERAYIRGYCDFVGEQ